MHRFTVSAGHGNPTAGKRSPDGKLREFHFNQPVAERIGSNLITQYENVEVKYLHDLSGERDTALATRSSMANDWHRHGSVSAHIDVHANAFKGQWGDHTGIETFVHPNASQRAVQLAGVVQADLVKATGLRDRGVKRANFHMLRETTMPAILVEYGFMDSRHDFPLLMSDEFRLSVADITSHSFAKFFGLRKKEVAPEPVKGKEEEMAKEAIVINSFADYPIAELMQNQTGAGIWSRREAEKEQKAAKIYIIGGNQGKVQGDEFVILSGSGRIQTSVVVGKHLGVL